MTLFQHVLLLKFWLFNQYVRLFHQLPCATWYKLFINFSAKCQPVLLFKRVLLFIFPKIATLYSYSSLYRF